MNGNNNEGCIPCNTYAGITLIAFVITIIVLLILAGVTIAMVLGKNGVIERAKEAKNKTEQASQNEKNDLAKTEDIINEYVTGIKVEQTTDTKPGELEIDETDSNTFIINSIEDLVFFAYDVKKGNNYQGKTVELGLSLDFNSTKSYIEPFRTDYSKYGYKGELKTLLTTGGGFIPIGTTSHGDVASNSFSGIFDGNHYQLINPYINFTISDEAKRISLFGTNYGTIKNLGVINGKNFAKTDSFMIDFAGIAAKNVGNIDNCYYIGNINVYAKQNTYENIRSGGIVASNNGMISNCYHYGKIDIKNESDTTTAVGGIVATTNSTISQCYSKGSINMYLKGKTYCGGIGGTNEGTISNCYNSKNIILNENLGYAGGIVGLLSGTISNSYNYGNMQDGMFAGGIIGGRNANIGVQFIENSYYLQGSADKAGYGLNLSYQSEKNENEMKSESFVKLLNSFEQNFWKQDINNINNGYPILSWQ